MTNHELIILALEQLRDGSYSPERRDRCQVLIERMEMSKQIISSDRQDDLCNAIASDFRSELKDFFFSVWLGFDADRLEDKIADAVAEKILERKDSEPPKPVRINE